MNYCSAFITVIIAAFFMITGCATKTPFIQSCTKGESSVVQKMIKEGVDINQPDSNGTTPLMHAITYSKPETALLLIDQGADIQRKDKYGYTALIYAVQYNLNDVAKLLIEKKADLNTKEQYGETPLSLASGNGNIPICKLLIENGADVNTKSSRGATPLHAAAAYYDQESSPQIIKMLLDKGANTAAKDSYGFTPLKYAMQTGNVDNVVLIRSYDESIDEEGLSLSEALRVPSRINPEPGTYAIPPGKERKYQRAVADCNDLVIRYKTGLLFAAGPVGYGAGLLLDAVTTPGRFQQCMGKMGFECVNNCQGK
jgi:ankyrin repeat protein